MQPKTDLSIVNEGDGRFEPDMSIQGHTGMWTYDFAGASLTGFPGYYVNYILTRDGGNFKYLSSQAVATDDSPTKLAERIPWGEVVYDISNFETSGKIESSSILIKTDDAYICLYMRDPDENSINVTVLATAKELCDKILHEVMGAAPPPPEPDPNEIKIGFWNIGRQGTGVKVNRKIGITDWESSQNNYVRKTADGLDSLMRLDGTNLPGGKLMLWYGEPGTGKTSAIRAMAHAWRNWASVEYVLDPEQFFNVPGYMLNLLLRESNDYGYPWDGDDDSDTKERYKLIVIEDSDEFLRADSRNVAGQGMGRLLNVADGLVGQGLKVVILITTNEDIKSFHPAITRPGRCLADVKFSRFTTDEANEWLSQHGSDKRVSKDYSLAELFELVNDTDQIVAKEEARRHVGQYL